MSRSWKSKKHISKRWFNGNYKKGRERTKIRDVNYDIANGSAYKKIVNRYDVW